MKKVGFIVIISLTFFLTYSINIASPDSFLFAKIEKIDNKYFITKISNYEKLTFNLNNLTPQFDTKTYRCSFSFDKPKTINPSGSLELCKDDEKTFRKLKVAVGSTAFTNIFSFGLGAVMGFNLRDSVFDKDEFEKAIKESCENTKINREELLKMFIEFSSDVNKMYENYLLYSKNGINFNHVITDKSGFFKSDIDFSSLYNINKLPTPDIKISFNPIEENYKEFFYKKLTEIKDKINNYNYTLIFKPTTFSNNYNISISVEENNIPYSPQNKQNINLNFVILSKNFDKVYPNYSNEDKNIKIIFDGKRLNIFNKTPNFIQIKSIAIYYNNAIKNISYQENNLLELPPNSYLKDPIPVEIFENSDIQKSYSYKNITLEIAKKIQINFGFALKYRIVEQNIDRTLYKVNSYNLAQILSKF